ncbi:MAG: efflux RND transporter permease subunit [Planctomycetaceae bacterium]|nr:efflux RND transporter permease subunit [Planctomycetaceae bacterium]
MFSRFFIDRPIFSSVISLVIALTGLLAIFVLPIAQFPDIVPPTISVSATYPGANSEQLAKTVTSLIESKVNGVDNMIYMSSSSSNNGLLSMNVTFEIGTNPDIAAVNVNNRVQQAMPTLPTEVQRQGVTVQKKSTSQIMVIALYDPKAKEHPETAKSSLYLCNYANVYVKDVLSRVPGVGQARIFDQRDFGMRIWLDPQLMAARNLSVQDVINVIKDQNVQVAAGKIGQAPAPKDQKTEIVVTTLGRFENIGQFENLVIRVAPDGGVLKLKDIGTVEMGAQTYSPESLMNGQPASVISIYQLPEANALDVAQGVYAALEGMKGDFERNGVAYTVAKDMTRFVTASIKEVRITLAIAIALVVFTVYVFLQDWRAVLIPTLAIPVSLLGAFALLAMFRYTINTFSLFGIVLAIGIVVDDAIVVVENCQRIIDDEKLSAREAAYKTMMQVQGPVIATALVLLAVFLPTAFIPGLLGRLFSQFALTIAGATAISALCALTLSPALCAILLRPSPKKKLFVYRWFNNTFDFFSRGYLATVGKLLRLSFIILLLWGGLLAGLYLLSKTLPTGFLPNEDQACIYVEVRMPDGASFNRTKAFTQRLYDEVFSKIDEIECSVAVNGASLMNDALASNSALFILALKEWDLRTKPGTDSTSIVRKLTQAMVDYPEAQVFLFQPPPIIGLGSSGGLQLQLQDQGLLGSVPLYEAGEEMIAQSKKSGLFTSVSSAYRPTVPKYYLDIDQEKARKLQVPTNELFLTLQTYFGSYYVNDFNLFEHVYKVMLMADNDARARMSDLTQIKVRNQKGEMVPISTFVKSRMQVGPDVVYHFNMHPSTKISAQMARGASTGEGMKAMERFNKSLPGGFGIGWIDSSYQENLVGNWAIVIFFLATVFAFLVLAAQYESWAAPIIILMAVPLAVVGAFLGILGRELDFNVYSQVGLVILIGLSAKNSILIVEFARDARKEGKPVYESAMEASRLRLRPILMTSFAFILGVLPLMIAVGAGAFSRQAIGTVVFFGMIAVTAGGIFVTPALYLLIQTAAEKLGRKYPR